jgi:hypothetical protein
LITNLALAGELVGHRGHARAAHPDAGALRIEPRVVRLDGDLGADARVARRGLDLDQPLLDLRDLELEQTHQELRRDPRQDELRPLGGAVDLGDERADAVAHAQHFLGDQLVARDHAFDAARLDDHVAALDALDRAGQQVVLAVEEVVEDLLALGVADLLQDHLLRRLRADAAEGHRLERLLDDVAQRERRGALRRVGDRELVRGLLVVLVGHDGPAAEGLVIAGFAVDRHARVDFVGKALFRRRRERRLERREHDVLGHVLLARQRVDQQQQFAVHVAFLHSILGTRRALSIPASGIDSTPFAVSTRTAPSSHPRSIPLMRRALFIGSCSRRSASSPAKRRKSAGLRSGRAIPGDDTSRRSKATFSTANRRVRWWLTRAQSSTSTPLGLSMKTRTSPLLGDISHATSS